jgi:segregation and condensation protein B
MPLRGPEARRRSDRFPADQRPPALYRLRGSDDREAVAVGEGVRDARLAVVEAVLLAADEPLNPRRLATVASLEGPEEARRVVRKLQSFYRECGSAFDVEELAGGYQLFTRPEFHTWVARLRRTGRSVPLSAAARETLAIVAYRQPIMRAEVEAVRGVQCGDILRQLLEKGLVRIAGRHESLGRPVLYGTTRKFLEMLGLNSLADLPLAAAGRTPPSVEPDPKTDSESRTGTLPVQSGPGLH